MGDPGVLFLGCTEFSEKILISLLKNKVNIKGVFTIPEKFSISYSSAKVQNTSFSDLRPLAEKNGIPCYTVESGRKKLSDYLDVIKKVKPELILVMGWYYMIPAKILNLPKYGVWGVHASLLPEYAGGAPLVWAIIEGCKHTGVTLFRMKKGVDNGDIIAQKKFKISENDTIKEVYRKATKASIMILDTSLKNIDNINYTPQVEGSQKIYPQRSPEDGKINFNKSGRELYNFIRAQAAPYPGAFFIAKDGKKVVIEKARLEY